MLFECSQSLYTLKIRRVPNSTHTWIAVTSGELILRSIQFDVDRFGLIRMNERVLPPSSLLCVGGYIVVHPLGALELPRKSMYGSCIRHRSYVRGLRELTMCSWFVSDF